MFVRFASPRIDCDSRRETGIFTVAYELKDSNRLKKEELKELCELLKLFERELAIPRCYRDQHVRIRYRSICWFKESSADLVQSIWLMAWFLRERGVKLQEFRTRSPGRVLYEDKHQIAAIPPRRARLKRQWI